MGKKERRLEIIKMLISSRELSKQDELIAELEKAGCPTAQATLSRALKLLRVTKVQNAEGRYIYVMPEKQHYRSVSDNHLTVTAMNRMGALGIRFSGQMAVVKTLQGHAPHVAYDIDQANLPGVLGTVAGVDTVILVLEEGVERGEVLNSLSRVIPMSV